MRFAALTNVADDSPTMLCDGLTHTALLTPLARTKVYPVIAAPQFTFYRTPVSSGSPGPRAGFQCSVLEGNLHRPGAPGKRHFL